MDIESLLNHDDPKPRPETVTTSDNRNEETSDSSGVDMVPLSTSVELHKVLLDKIPLKFRRRFKCPFQECGMKFNRKYNMERHVIKVHKQEVKKETEKRKKDRRGDEGSRLRV